VHDLDGGGAGYVGGGADGAAASSDCRGAGLGWGCDAVVMSVFMFEFAGLIDHTEGRATYTVLVILAVSRVGFVNVESGPPQPEHHLLLQVACRFNLDEVRWLVAKVVVKVALLGAAEIILAPQTLVLF
jgi:hypothetical protein